MFPTEEIRVSHFKVHVIKDDQYVGPSLRRGELWDGWMCRDLVQIYECDTDIIDIGANIGWDSLMFSDFGPVHCFEPIFHEIVEKNIQANLDAVNYPIRLYPYGLSSSEQTINMYMPCRTADGQCNYGGTSVYQDERSPEGVPAVFKRLDDVYSGVPSVMKIDVEGHELEVLRGAKTIIAQHKPSMFIEILNRDEHTCEITKFLKTLGYSEPEARPEWNFLFKPSHATK